MKLTEKQIRLGAKYLAVDDVGGFMLIGIPKDEGQLEMAYNLRSSEYASEFGYGLHGEYIEWKEELKKSSNTDMVNDLKRLIPWLFEKLYSVTYKCKMNGCAEIEKYISAMNKEEAIDKVVREVDYAITIKKVEVV